METIHSSASQASLPDILDPNTAADLPVRRICCIGAGYVGGPTAAVLALHNPDVRVVVVDRDQERIDAWKGRHLPILEPGLQDIVRRVRDGSTTSTCSGDILGARVSVNDRRSRRPNLFFSTACIEEIAQADMILISVNTPTKLRGVGAGRATDRSALEAVVRDVALHAKEGAVLVEKSTVPCRTGELINNIMSAHRPGVIFPVLSNPEFLSEGTAVRNLMKPDRVVIGCESTDTGHRAAAALVNLYAAWVPRSRIIPINIWSSELCKLVANAMLAQRISSINSISAICERTGADISEIARSVGKYARIGPQFLKSGLGFGGSCFRKDICSLVYLAESLHLPEVATYWQQVLVMNEFQRDRFARDIIATLNNSLRGKKITILGYAFKKATGDARESPALDVIRILLEEGPRSIAIFDPLCSERDIRRELGVLDEGTSIFRSHGPIEILRDPYLACTDSDAVCVLTDWDVFKTSGIGATPTTIPANTQFTDFITPTDILRLKPSMTWLSNDNPPTPPQSPEIVSLHSDLFANLAPEPACRDDCVDCDVATPSSASIGRADMVPLDWRAISDLIREPRWVFDGRGVLDNQTMAAFGFRIKTLGKPTSY